MALTIFKYEITHGINSGKLHRGAVLLYADGIPEAILERYASSDTPRHRFFVWALVDRAAPVVDRHLGLFLTGDNVPPGWTHIHSFRVDDTDGSPFLGHVFDGGEC